MSVSRILAVVVMLIGGVCAQVFYVNTPANPGTVWRAFAPGQLFPAGAGPGTPNVPEVAAALTVAVPNNPAWSALPPCGGTVQNLSFRGAFAVDDGGPVNPNFPVLTTFFSSDGTNHYQLSNPVYSSSASAPIAFTLATTPGSVVTGFAVDSVTRALYYTDSLNFLWFAPLPLAQPAGALLGPIGVGAGLTITGLGFELATNTLWACDQVGGVYNFFPGAPALAVLVSSVPNPQTCGPAGGCWTGLDVDNSNGPPAGSQPLCPGSLAAPMHIAMTDGLRIVDALNLAVPPIPLGVCGGLGNQVGAYGLGLGSDPQNRFGQLGANGPISSLSNLAPPGGFPTVQLSLPYTSSTLGVNTVQFYGLAYTDTQMSTADALTLLVQTVSPALSPPALGGLNGTFFWFLPNNPNLLNLGQLYPSPVPGASGLHISSPVAVSLPTAVCAGTSVLVQTAGVSGVFSDCWQFRASL